MGFISAIVQHIQKTFNYDFAPAQAHGRGSAYPNPKQIHMEPWQNEDLIKATLCRDSHTYCVDFIAIAIHEFEGSRMSAYL